jgi:D-alanyl-D-alanine carboxypeptidase (penicillin-binding protein 5/6)
VAVRAGEQLTERHLLEALLIPPGNNIAQILATQVAGSDTRFIAEINAEARALGMDHTTYTDPSGLDPGTCPPPPTSCASSRRRCGFRSSARSSRCQA